MTDPLRAMRPYVCDGCHRRAHTARYRAWHRTHLCARCFEIREYALACGTHNARTRGWEAKA